MKRKFLIFSAALLTVFGAALLQSCSSEYEYYAAEEYGYYTEEEIAAIKALGESYGVTINIDENTYEIKKTLSEFEEEIKYYASLMGEYEILPDENKGENMFIARKKESDLSRALTRSAEGSGKWDYTFHKGIYNFSLSVSWKEATGNGLGNAFGVLTAQSAYDYCTGHLNCQLGYKGSSTVLFSGWIMLKYYTYHITQGAIDIKTKYGSFFFENDPHSKTCS